MAVVEGGLQRALLKYPKLDLSNVKLVGWGAGQIFKYFYPYLREKLQLSYTVCPNAISTVSLMGVEVRPLNSLRQEDPNQVLVVIFADKFFDVMHAIRDEFGDIPCVRALSLRGQGSMVDENAIVRELDALRSLEMRPLQRRWTRRPNLGIFVQGLPDEQTPNVLAWNRLHYPDAYQCMVTWDRVDHQLLERCTPWLDKISLVPAPTNPGYLYLNSALRSARLGLEELMAHDVEFGIRCRTDTLIVGSPYRVLERHFTRERGQGKLAISINSWKAIPFMFSMMGMIGRVNDLYVLWSQKEDERDRDHPDFHPQGTDHFLKLRHAVPECVFWQNYARLLNHPCDTLEDSHLFMRSRLLALEPDLELFSLKFIPLFSVDARTARSYTPLEWHEIYADPEGAAERAGRLQALDLDIEDFWSGRVG